VAKVAERVVASGAVKRLMGWDPIFSLTSVRRNGVFLLGATVYLPGRSKKKNAMQIISAMASKASLVVAG
jgi:hypothetical protein